MEQTHFAEKFAGVEVGHDHFAAVVVLDNDGDGAPDNVEQRIALITGIDDVLLAG